MDTGSANGHLRPVAPTLQRGSGSLRGRCVSNLDEESDPSGGEDLETQVSMPAFHNQPRKKQRTSSASCKAPSEAGFGNNASEANTQMVAVRSEDDYVCWYGCGVKGLKKLNKVGNTKYPYWCCKPCLSAKRCWVKQGDSNSSCKRQCKDIMHNQQEVYKQAICSMRIKPEGDWDSYLLPLN